MLDYDTLLIWETKELKAATFHFGGANPPDERKEGVANDYIFRSDSDRNFHCCPCRLMLYDLQGKTKIAATTANSDGCWIVKSI